jgi:hypothetical protein
VQRAAEVQLQRGAAGDVEAGPGDDGGRVADQPVGDSASTALPQRLEDGEEEGVGADDGAVDAVAAVGRGTPSAQLVPVDDVVVDEAAGVHEFEPGCHGPDLLGAAAHRRRRFQQQHGPQQFAGRQQGPAVLFGERVAVAYVQPVLEIHPRGLAGLGLCPGGDRVPGSGCGAGAGDAAGASRLVRSRQGSGGRG